MFQRNTKKNYINIKFFKYLVKNKKKLHIPKLNTFLEMIEQIAGNSYRKGTYNIYKHNCNNFTDDLTNILFNKTIR